MSADVETRLAAGGEGSLEEDLQRLKRMVEGSRVPEARAYVQLLAERWPGSSDVQYWNQVLAPPSARPPRSTENRSVRQETAWLRDHAHEYPGQWLAVRGNQLVAASNSLAEVNEQVRVSGNTDQVVLLKAPEPEA
ncbi:MAG: hypothetical protein ACO1SX_07995 [Actinomycetota bacterium]